MPLEKNQLINANFTDYTGGINVSVAPQLLAENEYQQIQNFEYDYSRLRTRAGISPALSDYPSEITAVYWDKVTNTYLVCLADSSVYEEDLAGLHNLVGTLTGEKGVSFCKFDNKVFIASGGKLQYYDGAEHTLATIEASYLSNIVFERFGRLVTTVYGDDNLYYSAVGDPYETGWEDDTNRDDSSKTLEVGYKDDGDIIKVLPMSGDILVFKSNGNVYSVSGEYPNWSVQLVAAGLDYISDSVVAPVNTQICYITNKGLNTLQAAQTYGNFTTNLAVGNKFNGLIVKKLLAPAMYNIGRKHQLLIQPDANDKGYIICFQYDIGAAITFRFPIAITTAVDTDNGVIFAAGNSLYRWDKQYTNDLGYMSIEQEIVTRKFESSRRLYTRQVDVGIEGTPAGLVEFYWADKRLEYFIKEHRRLLNVFSVCRDGVFTIKTKENIWIDYIKFYLFEK